MSKSVADTLLKYRCVWDEEEPIITTAQIKVDSPKDPNSTENKKTKILPDSSTITNIIKINNKIYFFN